MIRRLYSSVASQFIIRQKESLSSKAISIEKYCVFANVAAAAADHRCRCRALVFAIV